jgi:hypothetical protein
MASPRPSRFISSEVTSNDLKAPVGGVPKRQYQGLLYTVKETATSSGINDILVLRFIFTAIFEMMCVSS